MKRVIRVNPGFVLISASAIALAFAACVEEGEDAPPLPGAAGNTRMMTAAGGSAGSGNMAGSGGGGGSSGAGQGGSAGGGNAGNAGTNGAAGTNGLPDAGADAGN